MTYELIGLWTTWALAAAGVGAMSPPLLVAAGAADAAAKQVSP